MFQTARFKIHNPSRHKRVMLRYAMEQYHLTAKRMLEQVLQIQDLKEQISRTTKSGKQALDTYKLEKVVRGLAPKNWCLAPLRDYLISDVAATVLSYMEKVHRGDEEAQPPAIRGLEPLSREAVDEAVDLFTSTIDFELRADHRQEIEKADSAGQWRLAIRLTNTYASRAASSACRDLLRSLEVPLPRPLEFTRNEIGRGFLIAEKAGRFFLLIRLFSKGHRYWRQVTLEEGFINWRTKAALGGVKYPGVVLPLEFAREYHDEGYLHAGDAKSMKLFIRRDDEGREELFAHITFEFTPEQINPLTIIGLDRGSARIGAASVVDLAGNTIAHGLALEGAEFHELQREYEQRIAEAQRKGQQKRRLFRLRGRMAQIVVGEYANQVIRSAVEHKAVIALEDISGKAMGRYLNRSQFQKLQFMLEYKSQRVGLPKPITVPAAYTSQTCARCGYRDPANRPHTDAEGKAIQHLFRCRSCDYEANADDNASEVIALRALHQQIKGGQYQKFPVFQQWLAGIRCRDSQPAPAE